MITENTFSPSGEYHFVRFSKPAEQTEGGIYLPERCRENFVEAEILTSGPGKKFDGEHITPLWVQSGDVVVFQKYSFIPLVGQREGLVRDSELVAHVMYNDTVFPMNDWVMIDRCNVDEFVGSIVIPEEYRTRHKRGTLLKWGPGSVIKTGKLAGRRMSISGILGLYDMYVVENKIVRWSDDALFLTVVNNNEEFTFVRASDLDFVEMG